MNTTNKYNTEISYMKTEQEYLEHLNTCIEFYKKEESKLSYNINVIDELHINENAHSRILMKLLQFEEGGTYPFLKSFLLSKKVEETISKPEFITEKSIKSIDSIDVTTGGRIDLFVKDEKYTLIFENKIYNAPEQPKQVQKYINDVINNEHYSDNYYIFYLTRDGDYPTEKSLDSGERKKLQGNGTLHAISYKTDIIDWLEIDVLPMCRVKEENLVSAVKQYIDYLRGIYFLRSQDAPFATIIKNKISEIFIIESFDEKIKKLQEYKNFVRAESEKNNDNISIVKKIGRLTDLLYEETVYDIFSDWKTKIENEFLNTESNSRLGIEIEINTKEPKSFGNSYPRVGIKFDKEKKTGELKEKDEHDFYCLIEVELNANKDPYIIFWTPSRKRKKIVKDFLEDNLEKINKSLSMNSNTGDGYFYTRKLRKNYNDIYEIFINICKNTINLLEEQIDY